MGNEIEATPIYPGKLYPQQNKSSYTAGKKARMMRLICKIKENNRRGISNHDKGPNPLSFQSISILFLLSANASLIALQWSYVYLFSFLTWRPIVCAPVGCSHHGLFHPHVDSCHSYRYPLASIPI